MTRTLIAALSLSLSLPTLAACETPGATGGRSAAGAPEDDGALCEEDSPTGSHMRAKACRSSERKTEEKRSADQYLHKPQQGPGGE